MAKRSHKTTDFSQYCLNAFRINGLDRLDAGYRLVRYSGLVDTDLDYEKKARLLANTLGGDLKLPVEPSRIRGEHVLAVMGARERLAEISIRDHVSLNPEIARLNLDGELHTLSFRDGSGTQSKLARRALLWSIQRLASKSANWWSYDRRFVKRLPDNEVSNDGILVYPAFYYGLIPNNNGEFELVIDPSVCYIERPNLFEKYGMDIPTRVVGGRYLYKYGEEWYKIDALGISNPANREMTDPGTGDPITIWEHIVNRIGHTHAQLISGLSPTAPTIAYKTRGGQSRRAHSGLLFGMIGVEGNGEGEPTPHEESIMSPSVRGERAEKIVQEISSCLTLFGESLKPSTRLYRFKNKEVTIFEPPRLRFAGDQEIPTILKDAGRDRFRALRGLGPAETAPFADEQMFIRPESMPDGAWKDFKRRFLLELQSLCGVNLSPSFLKYDDRSARKLREQARAIEKVIDHHRGYALVVMPAQKSPGQQTRLHHFLKRNYWGKVLTQCADLECILSFYHSQESNGEERWFVRKDRQGRYQSYLRYLALGYLMVNCKWLWKLGEDSLRNQVHIGIDVYKGMAVFTFIYGDAELITFKTSKAIRHEKLSEDQVWEALVENLGADLAQLDFKPSTIIIHRDGKLYESELRGIKRGVDDLMGRLSSLPQDVRVGVVEIHKTSATRPRLYERYKGRFVNPPMGLFARSSDYEGALATTGYPMLTHGTAHPLYFEVVAGNIDIDDIAHDIYTLSHLAFASPGSCMRLPFTIALADFVLCESTPGSEDTLWEDVGGEEQQNAPAMQLSLSFRERRT
jgi:argonaute-like protein